MENLNSLELGTKLLQYRIEEILGQGGFGITYLAEDEDLQRKVAIKECYPGMFVSRQGTTVIPTTSQGEADYNWALKKFRDEATTLAKFKHPGIVQVLQIIKDENNTAYMVLEFVEGQSFENWLKGLDQLPNEKQLRALTEPLFNALEVIHKNNYTHRDIAPDNIYIRTNGKPVLLDFGAARLDLGQHSKTLNLVVKDGFSPPEQYYAEGRQGPWTDIYSFAATLYRGITGARPIDAMARLDAINNDNPDPLEKLVDLNPPGFSQNFLAAMDMALAPQMKNRPQDIASWKAMLFSDVGSAAAGKTVKISPASVPGVLSPTGEKSGRGMKIFGWTSVAILLAGMVSAGGYFLWQKIQKSNDLAAWQQAQQADNSSAYKHYLTNHPEGQHIFDAGQALSALAKPWSQTIGGSLSDSGHAITPLPDGGIIVAGRQTSSDGSKDQAWLARLDQKGKRIWEKKIGKKGVLSFQSVLSLSNGEIIAAGYAASNDINNADAFVVRLDAKGNVLWERQYGQEKDDRVAGLVALPGGDFILVGTTQSKGEGGKDGWVFRINSKGDALWEKTFGGFWDDEAEAVGVLSNGQIIVAGHTQLSETGAPNFWIFKLSTGGEKTFERKPGGGGADQFHSLITKSDGTAIFAGETSSFGKNSVNAIITRLTSANKLPPKVFSAADDYHVTAIDAYPDGSMLIAGNIKRSGARSTNAWIMKLNSDGETTLWERVLGGGRDDTATDITHLADGGLAIIGTTGSYGQGQDDIWIVKLDKNGSGNAAPD